MKLLEEINEDITRGEATSIVRIVYPADCLVPFLPLPIKFVFAPNKWKEIVGEHEGLSDLQAMREWLFASFSSSRDSALRVFQHQGKSYTAILERIVGKIGLYIFGAGHVGRAVALAGALVGYNVTVIDDRAEFASRDWLPDPRIRLVVRDFDSAIKTLDLGFNDACVIVTRGHQFDELCLRSLLKYKTSYLGMIGSKRRVLSIFSRLRSEGFMEEDFSRVHAPIGLTIGARSPQEIAIAILAEIIAEINKGDEK